MIEYINKVTEFSRAFGIPIRKQFSLITPAEYMLRYKLMQEENDEYLKACVMGDKVEIADALVDKLYILCGSIISHGMQDKLEECFNLIHENNMSKLDKDGKVLRDENGKVKKPVGFVAVDLTKIINNED